MPTPPIPRRQDGPGLSAQTLAWLAERPTPAARTLVYRVWSTLTELERSGRHLNPRQLSALLVQLLEHQPSPRTGRCYAESESGQAPRCPGRRALPEGVRREEESDQPEHAANRAVHDVDTHGQPREASSATGSLCGEVDVGG